MFEPNSISQTIGLVIGVCLELAIFNYFTSKSKKDAISVFSEQGVKNG